MKKNLVLFLAILTVLCLTACGNKEVENNNVDNSNEEIVTPVVNPKEKIAKETLIKGNEWKASTAYYTNDDGYIVEDPITNVYGKYAGVGGVTFNEDGTFYKFVGVYEAEEEADKTGTYTIDAENHKITFNYSQGEVVTVDYDYSNEGEVMYFIYKEAIHYVRFEPASVLELEENIEEVTEETVEETVEETTTEETINEPVAE